MFPLKLPRQWRKKPITRHETPLLTTGRLIRWTAPLAIAAAAAAVAGTPPLGAQQRGDSSQAGRNNGVQGRKVSLETQLRVGLKAVTKADVQFVERVVLLVQLDKLPRRLVDSTFLWARKRSQRSRGSHRLRPMVYFRPALVLRARRLGIRI